MEHKVNCQCDKCWNMRKNLRDKAVPLGEASEAAGRKKIAEHKE